MSSLVLFLDMVTQWCIVYDGKGLNIKQPSQSRSRSTIFSQQVCDLNGGQPWVQIPTTPQSGNLATDWISSLLLIQFEDINLRTVKEILVQGLLKNLGT